MPAQTRNSNKATTFKAYYAKKAPKQVFFPHKRKIVREKPGAWASTVHQPRQTTFIPEKLRVGNVVRDSDGEDEENEENLSSAEPEKEVEDEVEVGERGRVGKVGKFMRASRKRIMQETHYDGDEQSVRPTKKRARQPAKKAKGSPAVKSEPAADTEVSPRRSYASPSETEVEEDRRLRWRRQSTMTQLIEGRVPNDSDSEPKFQPVRRALRRSISGGMDKKQRTLTQMVSTLTPVPVVSDEEPEEEAPNGAYSDALARRLASEAAAEDAVPTPDSSLPVAATQNPLAHYTAVADSEDEDEDEEYYPTQHIPAPALRRKQTPKRVSGRASLTSPALTNDGGTPRRTPKSRFGLLATPERRKICEIPSSQSPPDTPILTQVTPAHRRVPLVELSCAMRNIQDTPSKRKKVMFSDIVKTAPQSGGKHRFGDAVRDSEDEDDDLEDLVDEGGSAFAGRNIGAETQMQINAIDHLARCQDAGAETQAELELIDQACAWEEEDQTLNDDLISPNLGERDAAAAAEEDEESQELGTPRHLQPEQDAEGPPSNQKGSSNSSAEVIPVQHSHDETQPTLPVSPAPLPSSSTVDPSNLTLTTQNHYIPISKDTQAITTQTYPPEVPAASQPRPLTQHTGTLELDLDGDPIQVRRSPPPLPSTETQTTNRSFSSKVEQQLQLKWSKSQFPPAHSDANESTNMPPPQWQPGMGVSQATTLDPTQWSPHATPKKTQRTQQGLDVTPRKTQRTPAVTPKSGKRSATITPHKIPNSQPFPSPARPDTLVIPSSFPTPSKEAAYWAEADKWLSPSGEPKWDLGPLEGSDVEEMEDFSIPAGPPADDGDDDEL